MPEALSLRPSSYCRALILQLLLVQLLLPFHRWPRHGFFVAEASVVVKSPWYGETGNRVRTVVKGMQLAQHLGTDVTFPELWLLKHRRFSFGPSAAANLTISGRAAYKLPESPRDPRGLGAYRHFDGAAINERLRGSLVDELQHVDPLPATHLVIHVRGGRGLEPRVARQRRRARAARRPAAAARRHDARARYSRADRRGSTRRSRRRRRPPRRRDA